MNVQVADVDARIDARLPAGSSGRLQVEVSEPIPSW